MHNEKLDLMEVPLELPLELDFTEPLELPSDEEMLREINEMVASFPELDLGPLVEPEFENLFPSQQAQAAKSIPRPAPAPGVLNGKSAISLRLDPWLLQAIKCEAARRGVKYQTMIRDELTVLAADW